MERTVTVCHSDGRAVTDGLSRGVLTHFHLYWMEGRVMHPLHPKAATQSRLLVSEVIDGIGRCDHSDVQVLAPLYLAIISSSIGKLEEFYSLRSRHFIPYVDTLRSKRRKIFNVEYSN